MYLNGGPILTNPPGELFFNGLTMQYFPNGLIVITTLPVVITVRHYNYLDIAIQAPGDANFFNGMCGTLASGFTFSNGTTVGHIQEVANYGASCTSLSLLHCELII